MQVESLGRFRIEKELGRGAVGRVFLAFDPTIERLVAIKTITIFASLPEAERDRARLSFVREARAAGKLHHPGIVTIFDVGESGGVPYLAMEFVEGETLDAACREGGLLPVPVVVELMAATAEALGFAHERGIIHRDIKPANLMRVSERTVKIMDFGLARNPAASMTQDGALVGTPNYMSPEQVRGDPLDGRSDLFSLAIVCYELLTGAKPFEGDSISSVLYRIVNEPPKNAPLGLERIPPSLAAFLERALAKDPDARFRDGAEFAGALRRAGVATRPTVGPSDPPKAHPPAPAPAPAPAPGPEASSGRSRRPRIAVLAAVLVVLAALGGAAVLGFGFFAPPEAAMLTARVRTEPAGVAVRVNGSPLNGDTVRFSAEGPFEVLVAASGCREAKHRVDVADAGREIVLVLDPTQATVVVDPGVAGARVSVNGRDAGAAPATLELDLCRDNAIEVQAEGYRGSSVTIPAKATPFNARHSATELKLEAIPMGRMIFPASRVPLEYFVDGELVARSEEGLELPAGPHEVRAVNDERFIDLTVTLDVPAAGTVTPEIVVPPLARLVVQTFPPNCRVALKRSGSDWRQVGETPLRYDVAAGRYVVRVEARNARESREQDIDLAPGANAPVRVSFGRTGR